jgi:anthranilate phosphoribosyltransferase
MSAQSDLRPAIRKLAARTNLSDKEISLALDAILSGGMSDATIAAFLVALAMKGETAEELKSILLSLRRHATRITPDVQGPLIDTCGTGGDSIRSCQARQQVGVRRLRKRRLFRVRRPRSERAAGQSAVVY